MFEEPSRLKPQDDDPNDREPSRAAGDYGWALSADEQYWNEAVAQDVRPLEDRLRRLRERDLLD